MRVGQSLSHRERERENSQQFVLSINGEFLSFPFPLCTPEGRGYAASTHPRVQSWKMF